MSCVVQSCYVQGFIQTTQASPHWWYFFHCVSEISLIITPGSDLTSVLSGKTSCLLFQSIFGFCFSNHRSPNITLWGIQTKSNSSVLIVVPWTLSLRLLVSFVTCPLSLESGVLSTTVNW